MSTYDPKRFQAEGHDSLDSGAGTWPPLDQPSELVQRLRSLQWPEASPQARQRCWQQLSAQMDASTDDLMRDAAPEAEANGKHSPGLSGRRRGTDGQHDRRFGRHDFAIRLGTGRHTGALGERVAATRGLASAARI